MTVFLSRPLRTIAGVLIAVFLLAWSASLSRSPAQYVPHEQEAHHERQGSANLRTDDDLFALPQAQRQPSRQHDRVPPHAGGTPVEPPLPIPATAARGQRPLRSSNGYLVLPPTFGKKSAPRVEHPIFELMRTAEDEWNAKLARRSKTLEDCVIEYRMRYGRKPPRGFDRWWAWAQANGVKLVDEYDQTFRDIEPFLAIEPAELQNRLARMEAREETFTLKFDPTVQRKVSYVGEYAELERAHDLGNLIDVFADQLPASFQMTFTRHDNPAVQLGWEKTQHSRELARQSRYRSGAESFELGAELSNWARGCAPDSPLREAELKPRTSLAKDRRSFIYNHTAAMDICEHPEIRRLHGYAGTPGTGPTELEPLFTFAKTTVHSDILATPYEQYSPTYIGVQPDWEEKTEKRLLWRGSTTGAEFAKDVDWQNSQRARLHFMSHETTGSQKVLWVDEDGAREDVFSVKQMNERWLDTSFAGEPVQCDEETCEYMSKTMHFQPFMGLDESNQYRYLVDVDGNGWSGRFHRLMSTKSAVLKASIFPEWYGDRIQPWLHYIPLKVDYTDLYDIMAFFLGRPTDGKGAHDELGHKIAEAGRLWALEYWRPEDMSSYMFRSILEWIRVLHRDEPGYDTDYDM